MTPTKVQAVYDRFFGLITDDYYGELTEEEVKEDCGALLRSSIPVFEFPDGPLDIEVKEELGEEVEYFKRELTLEEINILAHGMMIYWIQRQIASIELTRQKFSGSDFKLTSQASHLAKMVALLDVMRTEHRRLQILHSRRRTKEDGTYENTFNTLVDDRTRSRRGKRNG